MDESSFNRKVDDTLEQIESALEDCDADLDWDLAGGILTIECENSSPIIVNRQGPSRQIWVATRGGGFHFDYDDDNDCWQLEGQELLQFLGQALSEQCGESITLA